MSTGNEKTIIRARRERWTKTLRGLWAKVNEDWIFNFSSMLAYSYLTALAPILLALVAIGSVAINALAPSSYNAFVQSLASNFPPDLGQPLVNAILDALRHEAGALFIIALIFALVAGSRLFVTLESIFAIIYRTAIRRFFRQNAMALLMLLLFALMMPLLVIAASLPSELLRLALPAGAQPNDLALSILGIVGSVVIAFAIFAAIYFVVPNQAMPWRGVWPGALLAAVLLMLFEEAFPLYRAIFLRNPGYGTAIGLAIVVLAFLYVVGVITLLGAEVNSWALGLRPRGASLPEIAQRATTAANAPTPR